MGNIASMARASTALDSYVAELGNDISYDKSLSSSRFLKTIVARHANGPLVLKIFIKPDAAMSLRVIQRRLKAERDALSDLPNVNTYQTFVETDKAGYLIRQWMGSNLYDRVSTQPYLADIEKKWIAFQLLTCLRDARIRKVPHGDIKSENVLITSDLTVLLTDFSSSFKPTFLPLDDPSDFSFFFDTSSRRTCYIAPERFYTADSKVAQDKLANEDEFGKRDGRIAEEMDVFSAGCVLAEMWADGRTVFNLSELFAYRQGSVNLDGVLYMVDESVKDLIRQMLSLEPKQRPSFDRILATHRGTIFPEYFYTFLYDYVTSLESSSSCIRPSEAGTAIDRMLDEWESISVHIDEQEGPALLLLNVVTSLLRNCAWPASKLHGLQLLLNLSPHVRDEDRVDRIIPFVVELLLDESSAVRAEACRTIVTVIASISTITLQNSMFIPEYLLPQMRHLTTDSDVFVRATYARSLVRLADAALNMLELSAVDDYDDMLLAIQNVVQEQATTLLVDPASDVKRAMIDSIADLCLFFGRQKASETVLSHIMTYLNDRDPLLRTAFFDAIVAVGAFIGAKAVDEYVLPLMLQALADPEESVIGRVIASLTSLASLGLLPRSRIWVVLDAVKGFTYHPNIWIRQGAALFATAAARNLSETDTWCILYPTIRPMLNCDVLELDQSVLSALPQPLPRTSLNAAKSAALQNMPPGFWTAKEKPDTALRSFPPEEEQRILVLRDFIFKQAHAAKARGELDGSELLSKTVSLTDLGVTPQTIFLTPRTVDAKLELRRFRPRLDSGRRLSSTTNRSNPEDLRKRLAALESIQAAKPVPDVSQASQGKTPSESALSSTLDLTGLTRRKAAPAVAVHANAIGTTASTHPDLPYSSYEGPDPAIRAFLDQVDLENYREPVLDFGPRATPGGRKRGPRSKPIKPSHVTMIAHLTSHTGAITAIVPSPDHLFFATAATDGLVLIWDTARLERGVSARPRLTYRMDSPVSAMCRIDETHCLAVAAEDGQVHVVRVHTSGGKYKGVECIRSWQAKSTVKFLVHHGDSQLLCVLANSTIAMFDMRSMSIKTHFQHPLHHGPITAVLAQPHWVIVGTSTGVLSLWDLRFGLLLRSWATTGPITALALHPSKRRVLVATARADDVAPLMHEFDVEAARLVETFELRPAKTAAPPRPMADVPIPDRQAYLASLADDAAAADADAGGAPSVLAVIAGTGFGSLPASEGWAVTAGEDRVIRFWDTAKAADGFVICGSQRERDVSFRQIAPTPAAPGLVYTHPNAHKAEPVPRASAHAATTQRQPLRPHYDAVCALALVETPFSSAVVSADRGGVVKVWRLEGGVKA
ncbi:Serine/threonine-protein kinase [Cryptotrichosporon argae]